MGRRAPRASNGRHRCGLIPDCGRGVDPPREASPSSVPHLRTGVSREEIPILGKIFRALKIGNVTVPDQRFVVVRGLIVPAILGIDFWSRLGSLKLDLQRRRLVLEAWGAELELFSAARPQRDTGYVDLKLRRDVTVPAATEAIVPVQRSELCQGEEYLVEPVESEASPVSASYCIVKANDDDTMWIKVANVGATDEVLKRGEVIALTPQQMYLWKECRSPLMTPDGLEPPSRWEMS